MRLTQLYGDFSIINEEKNVSFISSEELVWAKGTGTLGNTDPGYVRTGGFYFFFSELPKNMKDDED